LVLFLLTLSHFFGFGRTLPAPPFFFFYLPVSQRRKTLNFCFCPIFFPFFCAPKISPFWLGHFFVQGLSQLGHVFLKPVYTGLRIFVLRPPLVLASQQFQPQPPKTLAGFSLRVDEFVPPIVFRSSIAFVSWGRSSPCFSFKVRFFLSEAAG